jgi:hypothetical protein
MGMAGDGGGRVELYSNRTTHVSLLVTICQDGKGRRKNPSQAQNPPFAKNAKGWGTRKV